jgi:UDP-glucose:tetrahydrobiopterin glucosyltransferase
VLERFPGRVAVHSHAQASTFKFAREQVQQNQDPFFVLPCGIDLAQYQFVPATSGSLCWIGRISPEKGLEDCAALAQARQVPVNILGRMQDVDYWYRVRRKYPDAPLKYRGFFSTDQMQQILGNASALLMTPKWEEAFGMVVVEALACGVPVITYRRGGPAEIVEDGKTGWIVPVDNIEELNAAVERIPEIDRAACRRSAEASFSLEAMTQKFLLWTEQVLKS